MSIPPQAEAEAKIWDRIRAGVGPDDDGVEALVDPLRARWGSDGAAQAHTHLRDALLGLGPLAALLEDTQVTDVLVNGTDGVWVDRGTGLERVPVELNGADQVRRLAVRLASLAGARLDDAHPWVDGMLPNGIRLHALLPPLVEGTAHLSLRVPRRTSPTLAQLQDWGGLDERCQAVLRAVVDARVAFLVTGGTGTGKTTLLAALLGAAPAGERIVVVEDVREIRVDHPHVLRLQARVANVEGTGEIGMTALVRQALRMRPDRLVVGEVRGAEVRELLVALNTGHEGGCGTVHANTAADVVTRIEALAALAGLSPVAARSQLRSAIRVVIHLARVEGIRRVTELAVLSCADGDPGASSLEVRVGWRYDPATGDWSQGPAWGELAALIGLEDGVQR